MSKAEMEQTNTARETRKNKRHTELFSRQTGKKYARRW